MPWLPDLSIALSRSTTPRMRYKRGVEELRVSFDGRRLDLRIEESLGFGRTNLEPGGQVGWGFDGRFLELGEGEHIHRIWGCILWRQGFWCVKALGSVHPVRIELAGGSTVELPPWTSEAQTTGVEPELLAISGGRFRIVLEAGSFTCEIDCDWTPSAQPEEVRVKHGQPTVLLGQSDVDTMSHAEVSVLWVMAREFRERADGDPAAISRGRPPRALEYSRIRRALGLSSERQATSAVERIVRRFREAHLLAPTLASSEQRDKVCELAVIHQVLDRLVTKYGEPELR